MPTTYSTPGVYINEVPAQNRPIEGVATSVAAFVGLAPSGPANVPVNVTSWTEFVRTYGIEGDRMGPYMNGAYLAHAVNGFFANGGTNAWIVRVGEETFGGRPQAQLMSAEAEDQPAFHVVAKEGVDPWPTLTVAAENGDEVEQGRKDAEAAAADRQKTIDAAAADLDKARAAKDKAKGGSSGDRAAAELALADAQKAYDEAVKPDLDAPTPPVPTFTVTIRSGDAEPETFPGLTATPGPRFLLDTINTQSKLVELKEPGELLPVTARAPEPADDLALVPLRQEDVETPPPVALSGDEAKLTGLQALAANDQVTMVCVPDLMALQQSDQDIRGVQAALVAMCSNTKRMAILDPPPGLSPQEIGDWRKVAATPSNEYATLYWPWVRVIHPVTGDPIEVPPCGHVAGIWARTDDRRGVHKAPANEEVMGVVDLASDVSDTAQGDLNMNGVNCLRAFRGRGIYTWGARTLATTTKPEWRYINVRRLFNYVSASILRGTQWAVFEPNDETLWNQLNVSVGNFLTTVWRTGAFAGATPDQAFFVQCDASTNPPDLVDAGQVNIHVGIAPVKPAEFVVFQISQYQPPNAG